MKGGHEAFSTRWGLCFYDTTSRKAISVSSSVPSGQGHRGAAPCIVMNEKQKMIKIIFVQITRRRGSCPQCILVAES